MVDSTLPNAGKEVYYTYTAPSGTIQFLAFECYDYSDTYALVYLSATN